MSSEPGFWDDSARAGVVMKERNQLADLLAKLTNLGAALDDVDIYLEMMEDPAEFASAAQEAGQTLRSLQGTFDELELQRMLGGEHDRADAILTINAGAGGTDSQDWAEMLLRMYLRYCERQGFEVNLTDVQPGQEAGIKSAELQVRGPYAYGKLKAEIGVHRLVRVSPFDSAGRRHTAFSSVYCIPELDTSIKIDIEDKDLRVDVYRAQGAGGQHVNKTESAVRIVHLPTGIVVQCQDERSQHKNKAKALKVLKAKLLEREQTAAQQQEADTRRAQVGSGDRSERIRTYNFPQNRVTDHRVGLTLYKLDQLIEGDMDDLLRPLTRQFQAEALASLRVT
jgi:peptide chain release factor 2